MSEQQRLATQMETAPLPANTYVIDDAIELLLAYREEQSNRSGKGSSPLKGDGDRVLVRMDLVLAEDATTTHMTARQRVSPAPNSHTIAQLEQWWAEAAAGLTAATPKALPPPPALSVSTAAVTPAPPPAASVVAAQTHPMTLTTTTRSEDGGYASYVGLNASTHEVTAPAPRGRHMNGRYHAQQQLPPPPPQQQGMMIPQWYGSAHANGYANAPVYTPPPQPSIVVKAQPNMRRERAGQNGIAWVIH